MVKLIANSQSEDTRYQAAHSLGEIDPGNESAIAALVKLIATSQDEYTPWQAADSLKEILPADQMAKVIIVLSSDFKPSEQGYKVISHCAQNMPYSAFYQAWHHRSYMRLAITFLQYYWWLWWLIAVFAFGFVLGSTL